MFAFSRVFLFVAQEERLVRRDAVTGASVFCSLRTFWSLKLEHTSSWFKTASKPKLQLEFSIFTVCLVLLDFSIPIHADTLVDGFMVSGRFFYFYMFIVNIFLFSGVICVVFTLLSSVCDVTLRVQRKRCESNQWRCSAMMSLRPRSRSWSWLPMPSSVRWGRSRVTWRGCRIYWDLWRNCANWEKRQHQGNVSYNSLTI